MSDLVHNLLSKFQKKNGEQFKLVFPPSDFIPYVCHLDDHTILLKNTHILQSLKIVGFSREIVESSNKDIRETIRQALNSHINDPNISVWIHTIRTRRNLDPGGRYNSRFCRDMHNEWNKKNYWHDKYINEVYITIVYSSDAIKFKSIADIINYSSLGFLSRKVFNRISANRSKLNQIVDNICESLKEFGIQKLGIYQNASGLHSECIEFFSKIINLEDHKRLLPIVDLSEYINDFKSAFGNNTFQITTKRNKHFATIISLKEYHEVKANLLDKLITLPVEMVISQTINFIDKNTASKSFKYQDYILKVSLDFNLREKLKFDELFNSSNDNNTQFGHSQTSLMVTGNNLSQLNQNITRCIKMLDEIGFVSFREDLNMEDIYWAQLPGNFHFVRRKTPISFKQFGGFAILNNTTSGKKDNIWGNAVTLFRTVMGTPYFFNFHNDKKGNTIIVGDDGLNKTLMFNFLLAISTKYQPKILVISTNDKSKLLAHAINAQINNFEAIGEDFNYAANNINFVDCKNALSQEGYHDKLMEIMYNFIQHNTQKKPLIIAIDQLDNIPFNDELNDYIKELQTSISKANGIFLIGTDILKNEEYSSLYSSFDSKIIFTNKAQDTIAKNLKINASDQKHIAKLSNVYKQFMLIKPGESVIAELNLAGMNHMISILSGDPKSYEVYDQNKENENWLNLIYQNAQK